MPICTPKELERYRRQYPPFGESLGSQLLDTIAARDRHIAELNDLMTDAATAYAEMALALTFIVEKCETLDCAKVTANEFLRRMRDMSPDARKVDRKVVDDMAQKLVAPKI